MSGHHHEGWQIQESARGGRYCAACGEHLDPDLDGQALGRAAADMAHRDDLARDVARLWPAFQRTRMNNPEATAESIKVWDELMAAFDRLAAAYGEET